MGFLASLAACASSRSAATQLCLCFVGCGAWASLGLAGGRKVKSKLHSVAYLRSLQVFTTYTIKTSQDCCDSGVEG